MVKRKKVTLITTFIMDDSKESIDNFNAFREGIDSNNMKEHIEGEGWGDVKITLTAEDIEDIEEA